MNRPAPLFILSTGRSGTTSIANMLSAVPGVVIVHERRPKLLKGELVDKRIETQTGDLGNKVVVGIEHHHFPEGSRINEPKVGLRAAR